MIVKIAWKNVWRNKLRSSLVIISVILGLWAGTFLMAYIFGLMEQRIEDAIGYEISHLQFHHPEFLEDNDPQFLIRNSEQLIKDLTKNDSVIAVSGRVLAYGMVAAASVSAGGKFIGINPRNEQTVSQLSNLIVEGEYLNERDKNKVIIGRKLADKLKVKIRSKIVFTFQDCQRNIVAGAFRVQGIFKSHNSGIEERNLYVNSDDLQKLMQTNNQVHEVAVLLYESDLVPSFIDSKTNNYQNLEIKAWSEIAPELALLVNSIDQYMVIFLIIILLALSFGIVNTMLMAVLERSREIGVLMAIGMNKFRLFSMIFFETLFLVGIAIPFGLILAYASINYFGSSGIDLSGLYGDSYASMGFPTMIHPHLYMEYYVQIVMLVSITALLAAIYPAYAALKLDPVKAIRKL